MDNIIHNTITVQYGTRPEEDQYCLYWQDEHAPIQNLSVMFMVLRMPLK